MKPHGIIGDEWVVSYAAGALSEAHALVVASHIACHSELQEKLVEAENLGGLMLEAQDPVDIAQDGFEDVLAKLDVDDFHDETKPVTDSNLPIPLAQYLGKGLDGLKWRMMGPGMSQVRLWTGPNDERLWLLKAKGGTHMPMHDHKGHELTLVLQGSYHVGEQQFTPGLIEVADNTTINHEPIIDDGEDCICLVVTEAPIKLHSFIGRLCQPFIGL